MLLNLLPCSVTLYAEFLPTKQRAKCVVLLDVSDMTGEVANSSKCCTKP